MLTRLSNTDFHEMSLEIPSISLSKSNEMETELFTIDNQYAEASFQTVRMPLYSITDAQLISQEDLKIYSSTEENNYIWFCAALQGNITSIYNQNTQETWCSGHANMLTYNNVEGQTCFSKKQPFRMLEIMLTTEYLQQISAANQGLLDDIISKHQQQKFTKAQTNNINLCPQIDKAIKELLNYEQLGNIAPMYLDAKIREILALFLARIKNTKCAECPINNNRDNDLLIHAKNIIEQHYLNPPSIPQLAREIGTNECKLKKGFRTKYGATIFGYLFDYRMEKACNYLTNTNNTIQEIAQLVGYEHHSHFSTAFRRKYKLTPIQYRNKH